jgi:Flp pilus assembly protein TadG
VKALRRHLTTTEQGSATAEVAFAVPALMFLILLAVQFGLWYHTSNVVRSAAEQGVRAARVEGGTAADGQDEAGRFLVEAGSTIAGPAQITATRDTARARVEVRATANSVLPWIHLPVRAVAQSPVEAFRRSATP